MPHLLIKIFKIITLGVLPLLLISSIGKESTMKPVLLSGTYLFKASGDLNHYLKGEASFETKVETTSNGDVFSTLRLDLGSKVGKAHHTMEFLISKQNEKNGISKGNYSIKRIDSFLNHFDGVFGVVNIKELGETPFFATEGAIKITQLNRNKVEGSLNVELINEKGETINISGNFEAK